MMPAAGMMGEAAGAAAVQAIRTGQAACRLDARSLVESLREQNAYLPRKDLSETMTRDTI